MSPIPRTSSKRIWTSAVLLSLLLHLGILSTLNLWNYSAINDVQDNPPEPILFHFSPETRKLPPKSFTELPEDRVDTAPEFPDFLSNIDSRARDQATSDINTSMSQMDGRTEIPQVDMRDAVESPPERSPTKSPEERSDELLSAFRELRQLAPQVLPNNPTPVAEDIGQEALSNPEGNVTLMGDVSLNTAEWVFGKWMKSFRRKVIRVWDAPYAFDLGMMEGWTFVEIEVARSGRLLRCEVLDENGHESLRISSVNAIESAGPYEAFPARVIEETLTLRIKMIYSHYSRPMNSSPRGAR